MNTLFNDEVMLAGWKESHNSGAVVSFFLPDAAALDVFRGMTVKKGKVAGQRLALCLVEIGDDEKPIEPPAAPKKDPNYFARDLHKDGYFFALRLWLACHDHKLWTMQQHKAYIETLGCSVQAFHPHQCNGDIVLHHAGRAEDPAAGNRQPENPQKAPHYFGVPVCHTAHTWIHSQAPREDKRFIREYAIKLTADKMKEAIKRHLKITSLSDITPEMLKAFEAEVGL